MYNWTKIEHLFLGLTMILCFSSCYLYAQTQRFSFHHLTPEEGLSQGSNDYIYHDSKGFIWLSSLEGLNRFDGQSVKVYRSIAGDSTSLLGNIITSNFFEDDASNLWFTTYEGVHCYIRRMDNFQHFQLKNEKGEQLEQDYHLFHLDKENQLWLRIGVGATGRLHIFDIKKQIDQILCPLDGSYNYPVLDENEEVEKIITTGFMDRKGMEVLFVSEPSTIQSYFKGKDEKPQVEIKHIYQNTDKNWYLSTDLGLVLFNPDKEQYKIIDEYNGLPIGRVLSSLSINDSLFLVGTSEQSLLIYNKNTKEFEGQIPHEPTEKYGLHFPVVNKMFIDSLDNIWVTSGTAGVSYTNLNKRKFDLPAAFWGQNIIAIFESSKGEIFCSYQGSETAYFSNRETPFIAAPIHAPPTIRKQQIAHFIEDAEGDIWGFNRNYLLKWNAQELRFDYHQNLPIYILAVYKTPNNTILLSTYSGLYEWKKKNGEIEILPLTAAENFNKLLATALYEDSQKRLYLALDASRLVVYEIEGDSYTKSLEINGIGYAKAFYEEDSILWVATSTGLLKINTEDLSYQVLNEAQDGIPNENYYSILPDEKGNFWLSSNKGIIRYNPTMKVYRRYTLADGLQGNEYNTNAFLKTSYGEIWMGGTKGLNRFFPAKVTDLLTVPNINFTRLLVNDESYTTEKYITELEELNLNYKNNTFSIDFVASEYSDPSNNRFRYRLENQEESWVESGAKGFARYSNLSSGNYTFQVKAANSDGVWTKETKQLKIHIQTPWWQTWWFYLICIIGVSAIIYGIFLYRLQQALKLERLRVRISSDLHDDVGTLLSGVAMQSELLELTAPKEQKAKLNRISTLSRDAMSRMRDTVWAIDARKDKLENLLDRIHEHAAETLSHKDIVLDLQVKDLPLDKNLTSQIRQNIYLICKESITNTAKHSNGHQMQIHFKKTGRNEITLTIKDNGKVQQKDYKTTGLGLSNIQMRAKQIGASLEMNQTDGFGMEIIFTV